MKIEDFNFAGKKAIVRVDFNVPLDENGDWGEPFDLGPTINAAGYTRSPLLHPDMKTAAVIKILPKNEGRLVENK